MPKRTKPVETELIGFPERLRSAREEAGFGVRELGEMSGMDGGRVSRYEQGKKFEGVTADSVLALAKALNVRPAWLLTGERPVRSDGSYIWVENTPQLVEALRQSIDKVGGTQSQIRKSRS